MKRNDDWISELHYKEFLNSDLTDNERLNMLLVKGSALESEFNNIHVKRVKIASQIN